MAWTAPRTWVTGETVTAAIFNTHVRDNLSYLFNGGEAGVATGAMTLTNDTYGTPTYSGTGYGTVTVGSTGITVGLAATYRVTVTAVYAANNTASRLTLIRKNGAGLVECGHPCCAKAGIQTVTTDSFYFALAAADRIDAQFREDIGGTLAVTGYITVERVGA